MSLQTPGRPLSPSGTGFEGGSFQKTSSPWLGNNLWGPRCSRRVKTVSCLLLPAASAEPCLLYDVCCSPGRDLMSYLVLSISLNPAVQKLIIHPHCPICLAYWAVGIGQKLLGKGRKHAGGPCPAAWEPGKGTEVHLFLCDDPTSNCPQV